MLSLENHFTGTYAKNVLADWRVIFDFIYEQTLWVKDTIQSEQDSNPLKPVTLTDLQISDALNGPLYQFFKPHFSSCFCKKCWLRSCFAHEYYVI